MPNTNSGIRVVDPVLTTVAQGYNIQEMVGSALFPRVPVGVRGGQIIEFGRDAFRRYATKRSPGSRTARIQFGYTGKPFALTQDALDVPLPREHIGDAAAVPGIDLGRRAVSVGMRNLLLSLEIDQATLATAATGYGANTVTLAGATKWSNAAGLPLANVDTGREAIRQSCGMYPNVLLLSAQAFVACKNNPSVVARFQYNGQVAPAATQITPQMLAGLFNVEKVVVGGAVYWNDANAAADVWGNNAILAYVPAQSLSLEEPSYGYTYTLEGNPLVEEPYWDAESKSWVYGVTFERVPVLSGIAAGYLIVNPN